VAGSSLSVCGSLLFTGHTNAVPVLILCIKLSLCYTSLPCNNTNGRENRDPDLRAEVAGENVVSSSA